MTKHYDLGMSFMGHKLYIALDDGVYGENDNQNKQEADYIKERYKDFMKSVVPDWVERRT